METIEHWKDVADRRRRVIYSLEGRIDELETELSDTNDVIDDYQTDISFWRDVATDYENRWEDKTELLKRIGELS